MTHLIEDEFQNILSNDNCNPACEDDGCSKRCEDSCHEECGESCSGTCVNWSLHVY